jgi:hypothetical protein
VYTTNSFLFLTLASCNDTTSKNFGDERKDTLGGPMIDESHFGFKISWLDSSKDIYQLTHFLAIKAEVFCVTQQLQ